jgi:hypothetical protein
MTGLVARACMWRTNRHECVIPASSCPLLTAARARWWRADRVFGVLSKLSQLPSLSPPRATAPVICSSEKLGQFQGSDERMSTLVGSIQAVRLPGQGENTTEGRQLVGHIQVTDPGHI